jgi:hypothetical protein
MTERMHDMPLAAIGNDTELPPSANWFSRHGSHFLGAKDIIGLIGIVPGDIRSYMDALAEEDEEGRILCNMALMAAKEARACKRLMKYGIDTALYTHEVKKLAKVGLGRKAMAAFARAQPVVRNPE